MLNTSNGFLIAVEGIDGSGKSSLVSNLAIALEQKKYQVLKTKEPGGTTLGLQLRNILNKERNPDAPTIVCPKAEFLLFAADRAQHFTTLVIPALNKNYIVISDRTGDSSLAYQGYGRGLDRAMIQSINMWATENRKADLVIYIRIDAQTAYQRVITRNKNLTSFEAESLEFWKKVGAGFDEMYTNRDDVLILDGTKTQEELCELALQEVLNIRARTLRQAQGERREENLG